MRRPPVVLIDIDKNSYFVVLYKYAKDRTRPSPTPTQHRGRP
jgi:hypothetical protein